MCGIIGLVGRDQQLGKIMRVLRGAMLRRGPDGEGEYVCQDIALGMRRLAIIDLETGDQPLLSADGQVLAFQNGEIYNYRGLKRELIAKGCRFISQSDTEVLAHGYATWGLDGLLERLDGMFALAILDRRSGELHLARDLMGEKPLYVASAPGWFAFASSLVCLAALPWVDTSIDQRALDDYLALHYVPGDATILTGVRRLLPGQSLTVSLGDLATRRRRYYRPSLKSSHRLAVPDLSEMVEQAVQSRLVADVEVGVFLSGGVDSSLVAAIAARHSPGIRTFSMGFADSSYDESSFAQIVAKHVGSEHTRFVFDGHSFLDFLPEVADALDEPLGDQALLPLYWLSREAASYVKVVLSGEGADELFGGYFYYRPFVSDAPRLSWRHQLRALLLDRRRSVTKPPPTFFDAVWNATPSGFPLAGEQFARKAITGRAYDGTSAWAADVLTWLRDARSALQRARAADVASWLPDDLLVKLDRMTMAHSIEGRAPYLQRQLVDAALALPDDQLISHNVNKRILRQVAERWLPAEIFCRQKQGFNLPLRHWLGGWLEGQGGPQAYFSDIGSIGLDAAATAQLVSEDMAAGTVRDRFILAIILLVEWHRRFTAKVSILTREMAQ